MAKVERQSLIVGITPLGRPNPRLAAALVRAGALGVLDLGDDPAVASASLSEMTRLVELPFGVRIAGADPRLFDCLTPQAGTVVLLPGHPIDDLALGDRRVLVEVTSLAEARVAVEAGAHGLIARGMEGGGRVGEATTFVLLQQLLTELPGLPVWAAGGVGLHSAAAAIAGGAAGVVLDSQLCLVRESRITASVAAAIRSMDGSETVVSDGFRVLGRAGLGEAAATPGLPIGQEGAFAAPLADRFVTAAGVVQAFRESIDDHLAKAVAAEPLVNGRRLTPALPLPVAQGPMTRVSDQASFARAVAGEGGLPFIALAMMNEEQTRKVLEETSAMLGERPWGVGILGFAPDEVRSQQFAAIEQVRPPVALIAGGSAFQARTLEALGITTYLHAPSPGLLARYLKDGARRFVFEGSECGGHIGPRASFPLWDAQIECLTGFLNEHPGEAAGVGVLFAGGIHDERSAAMVAGAGGALSAMGVGIGVLMGTAYLFTEEAVASGAVLPGFQERALDCTSTVLIETAPGHAIRCAPSPYTETFQEVKAAHLRSGKTRHEVWAELEELNLGRLRIAAKGLTREGGRLVEVGEQVQLQDGMFMIGQVAAMRSGVTRIAALHQAVTGGATEFLTGRIKELEDPAPAAGVAADPLDIAIVGMAGVFPGARDIEEFWSNILEGKNAITEVPAERWDPATYFQAGGDPSEDGKSVSKWGGFISDVPFDPLRFGIPPASLASIDPAQLLAMQVAAQALEDAGYGSRPFNRERTSVILGVEGNTDLSSAYQVRSALPGLIGEIPEPLDSHLPRMTEDSFAGVLGNVTAGRIANRLNLGGVNYTVDAACAASLAALYSACHELRSGTSEMVLCGAVDLHNGIHDYLLFGSARALSRTGRCATFDAAADGIALGEGVACVVLKTLAAAERDGDRIYAVVKGVAGSSDGRQLGMTAPSSEGQKTALRRAYAMAGVSPAEVGLIEAHGTGTVVGDRAELTALTAVFKEAGARSASCALGSVKSQVGHTKCAAGLAGLIKAARAIHSGVQPATCNLTNPNPFWDSTDSPFFFSSGARPWAVDPADRHAGVSAFGFGGTNFHAVLSGHSAGDLAPGRVVWPAELFLLRGADRDSALAQAQTLLRAVEAGPAAPRLRDLAYTASLRSAGQPVQFAFVAGTHEELSRKLAGLAAAEPTEGVFPSRQSAPGKIAFLFPGQGSQRPGMLRDLFLNFPVLQNLLALGDGRFARLMFPPAAFDPDARARQAEELDDTTAAQPALGIASLAAGIFLKSVGVEPDMVAGHSYGELVAFSVAGAFGKEDLIDLSVARARAIRDAAGRTPGGMVAVASDAAAATALLAGVGGVWVANHNSGSQTVISGSEDGLEEAVRRLRAAGIAVQRLSAACAFHSPVVKAAVPAFKKVLDSRSYAEPGVPVWSSMTAMPVAGGNLSSHLAGQLAAPVRFIELIERMYEDGARTFVEVGPGRVLTRLVGQILSGKEHLAVTMDRPENPGMREVLTALAQLAAAGVPVDPEPLFADRAKPVDPTASRKPPAWTVNGHLVRQADGTAVPNGLKPATLSPRGALVTGPRGDADREQAVHQFLESTREMIRAQRDVLLAYLGADPAIPEPSAVGPKRAPTPVTESDPVVAPSDDLPLDPGTILREVISARTGYPTEMLEATLDLEADLSIDSIKRAEIVGEMADRLGLDQTTVGDVDLIAELSRIKTIGEIVAWLTPDRLGRKPAAGARPPASADAPEVAPLTRLVRKVVELPPIPPGRNGFGDREFLLVDDGHGVALELCSLLESEGARVRVTSGAADLAAGAHLVDLTSLRQGSGPVLPGAYAFYREALLGQAAGLMVVTGSAGGFGIDWDGGPATDPTPAAGLRGLLGTIGKEFPEIPVRVVDVDTKEDPHKVASHLLDELSGTGDEIVVGYTNGRRTTIDLLEAPLVERPGLELGPESVVLLTGGARGITALASRALARNFGCHLELVGRTDPAGGAGYPEGQGAAEIRRALLGEGLNDPSEIETRTGRILAAQEVCRHLDALNKVAASVNYQAADLSNPAGVRAVVDRIYARHGRLDGVIHGAGILADRRIVDKKPDEFLRVFDAKVSAARALVDSLRPGLSFLICFGSVAGVYGNAGQADYAAANDALGTMTPVWARRLGARVTTIHWGPWASSSGGMVTPELERHYLRSGIEVIDPAGAVNALVDELRFGPEEPAEVLYTLSNAAWR